MKAASALAILFFCANAMAAGSVMPAPVPQCTKEELTANSPSQDDVATHRQFKLPSIAYPFGSKMAGDWDWRLTVKVDQNGHVACYSNVNEDGKPYRINDQRRKIIQAIATWHYKPFESNGAPAAAIVSESIDEWHMPEHHTPLPTTPIEDVHITLEKTTCFGSCPSYRIDLYGDGRVTYRGNSFVDVKGSHEYGISVHNVEALLQEIRERDLWSRPYMASMSPDAPGCRLTIHMGTASHEIQCGGGAADEVYAHFGVVRQIDFIAKSRMWVNLSKDTISQLKAENFDFHSTAAGKILFRAIVDGETRDDQAILDLMQLGAPQDEHEQHGSVFEQINISLINAALINRRAILIDPLISSGALDTDGVRDQTKINDAFIAAIRGGDPNLVKKIWQIQGNAPHPTLIADGKSVALSLEPPYDENRPWQGLEVVQWLVSVGCEIRGVNERGETLLHVAARAGDVDLVQFLVDSGLDTSAQDVNHELPLETAKTEDVAICLLKAGTDLSRLGSGMGYFRNKVQARHWTHVVAWLDEPAQRERNGRS